MCTVDASGGVCGVSQGGQCRQAPVSVRIVLGVLFAQCGIAVGAGSGWIRMDLCQNARRPPMEFDAGLSLRCGCRLCTSGTVAAASSSFSTSQCRRWVVKWWKCRTSCLRSSSRTLTFQFVVVGGVPKFLVEVFMVYDQDKVYRRCRQRQCWSILHPRQR